MLSSDEVAALTLRAPYVHEHGDRPYFMREVNSVASRLQEPAYLNFFVRYRTSAGSAAQHRWSRIEEVIFMRDGPMYGGGALASAAALTSDSAGATALGADAAGEEGETVGVKRLRPALTIQTGSNDAPDRTAAGAVEEKLVWRGKPFWVALVVAGESQPVLLPRLSAKLPTDAEVMEYCARQSLSHPEQQFSPPAAAAAAPDSASAAPPSADSTEGDRTTAVGAAEESDTSGVARLARCYLPSHAQIEKLRNYRDACITRHTWTASETDELAALHAQYASAAAGAAATPMGSTVNKVRNLQHETQLLQPSGPGSGAFAAPARSLSAVAASTGVIPTEAEGSTPYSSAAGAATVPSTQPPATTQPARSLRGSIIYTQCSPFLPKRRQRIGGHSTAATGAIDGSAVSSGDPSQSQSAPSPSPSPATQALATTAELAAPVVDPAMLQQWTDEYQHQLNFYHYIADEQRSGYLNKIASITARNALRNRRSRLAGIEYEKQLERQANFVESVGLWVTDDKLRAEKAAQYKAAQESSNASGATAKKADAPGKAAAGAGPAVGDGSVTATGTDAAGAAETPAQKERRLAAERLLDAFRQKRAAQEIDVDSVPEEWMNEAPAPVAGTEGLPVRSAAVSPSSPYRLHVPRAIAAPTAAMTDDARADASSLTETIVTSQLLHRSALATVRAELVGARSASHGAAPAAAGAKPKSKAAR